MNSPRSRQRGQAGVTLVELMITLLVLSIALVGVFQLGSGMVRSASDHRRNIEVEQATRASMDIVSDTIRNASPGVPRGDLQDLVGCSGTGGIRVINSTTGPDQLEVMHATGGLLTSVRSVFTPASNVMQVLDASQLRVGDYIVVTNLEVGHLLQIANITPVGSEYMLSFAAAPSALCAGVVFPTTNYRPGDVVVRAQISRFYIDSSALVDFIPTLMMDPDSDGPLAPEPLAAGIEDMQIAVGVDVDGDGVVAEAASTADEWFFNVPGDAAPPLITDPNGPPWRAIRLTMVGRAAEEYDNSPIYARPPVEDRAASAPDKYRRRVLTTTMEIRNMEGSP